jgi:hypothetical protein
MAAGLAWACTPPAGAQAIGPEFRVNSYTTSDQALPSVAAAADGRVVVTWESAFQDGSSWGVFGQRYDSNGAPVGPEFRVNSHTTEWQEFPSVAAAADGRFVVTWSGSLQDGSDRGVLGQRYDSNGAPVGPEFRVNSFTTANQFRPSVAAAADGRFVVTWQSDGQDGSSFGVFGQRYDSNGSPAGPEFRVNSWTPGVQYRPSVAAAADGRFVVTWASYQDGSNYGVFGQRYDSNGSPVGPEFRVNSHTTDSQYRPSVAAAADGRFVVTWGSYQDGSDDGIFGQRYDSNGAPAGPEFRVNSYTTDDQSSPSVAAAPDGRFVVTWASDLQDGSYSGVFGQRFDSNGSPVGPEFRVNRVTGLIQALPSVAAAPDGRFVVTWQSLGQDGSNYGVFGRRFHLDGIFADGFQGS